LQTRAKKLTSFLPYKSYGAQSGQIFGILKQMKEDFEKNIGEAQQVEVQKSKEFAELKAAKDVEIQEMETQKKIKESGACRDETAVGGRQR